VFRGENTDADLAFVLDPLDHKIVLEDGLWRLRRGRNRLTRLPLLDGLHGLLGHLLILLVLLLIGLESLLSSLLVFLL